MPGVPPPPPTPPHPASPLVEHLVPVVATHTSALLSYTQEVSTFVKQLPEPPAVPSKPVAPTPAAVGGVGAKPAEDHSVPVPPPVPGIPVPPVPADEQPVFTPLAPIDPMPPGLPAPPFATMTSTLVSVRLVVPVAKMPYND